MSKFGVQIESVFTPARVDFDAMHSKAKRKIFETVNHMATYLYRDVKRAVRTSSAKNAVRKQKMELEGLRGENVGQTPTQFIKGKRVVAAGMGRGGRTAENPVNIGTYRWNKASAAGQRPISHPTAQPGWVNQWLKNAVDREIDGNDITIFVNPSPPGKTVNRLFPTTLESGGSYDWSRKIHVGYRVQTISHGTQTEEGDGQNIAGKRDPNGATFWRHELPAKGGGRGRTVLRDNLKNKSGRTQSSHFRKWKEPRVVLTKKFKSIGGRGQRMAPRPFIAPAVDAFLRKHFDTTFSDILK